MFNRNALGRAKRFSALFTLVFVASACAQNPRVELKVDATNAPRGILHAELRIPAQPGKLTLLYPKWIPGEHGPSGPITDLVDLKLLAGGQALAWQRDPAEMYAIELNVPAGADAVDVSLNFLLATGNGGFSSSVSATDRLVDVNWNQVLLYPAGVKAADATYMASLRLPKGWQAGTALPIASQAGEVIEFKPASLETLIDSPVIAGAYLRTVDLSPKSDVPRLLHIAADSAEALEIVPDDQLAFSRLVTQAELLFGTHHYRGYHFLLTLSDQVGHFGLEHHESSDDRLGERYLIDPIARRMSPDLLSHEMMHSWNGKYRRPADIATPDYQSAMKTELLWVYEGLTEYLGLVLAARSGLTNEEDFRERLATSAAWLDKTHGRDWRPLADTAVAAQDLYRSPRAGRARRRGTDFYDEGALIWLEADVFIRQKTQGQKSLDDFCRQFFGGPAGEPKVVPYKYEDVLTALNEICPNDWRQFFQNRVYEVAPRAPLGGIESGGWKLAYSDAPTDYDGAAQNFFEYVDLNYSLGFSINTKEETVADVIPDSPADKAGVTSGMKLVAVNGRRYYAETLKAAIRAAKGKTEPIELLIQQGDFFKTLKVDYHDGERYPQLERDATRQDLLASIAAPLRAK